MTLNVVALYTAEHEKIRRYFDRRVDRREVADDLAADVWLRVWERRDRYHPLPGVPPRAWLYAIARNILMDHFRAERRCRPPVSLEAIAGLSLEPSATDRTPHLELVMALQSALATLTDKQRATVIGRYYDGKKQCELVDIAPIEGVKKLQMRALVNLRKVLGAA